MDKFIEKMESKSCMQNLYINIVSHILILMIGLIVGYVFKDWLF